MLCCKFASAALAFAATPLLLVLLLLGAPAAAGGAMDRGACAVTKLLPNWLLILSSGYGRWIAVLVKNTTCGVCSLDFVSNASLRTEFQEIACEEEEEGDQRRQRSNEKLRAKGYCVLHRAKMLKSRWRGLPKYFATSAQTITLSYIYKNILHLP